MRLCFSPQYAKDAEVPLPYQSYISRPFMLRKLGVGGVFKIVHINTHFCRHSSKCAVPPVGWVLGVKYKLAPPAENGEFILRNIASVSKHRVVGIIVFITIGCKAIRQESGTIA